MRVIGTITEGRVAVSTAAHKSLRAARDAFRRHLDGEPVVAPTSAGGPVMAIAPGTMPSQGDIAYTHEFYITARGKVSMRRTTIRRLRRMSQREFVAFCRAVGIKDDLSRGPITGERLNAVATTLARGPASAALARTLDRASAYVRQIATPVPGSRRSRSEGGADESGPPRIIL